MLELVFCWCMYVRLFSVFIFKVFSLRVYETFHLSRIKTLAAKSPQNASDSSIPEVASALMRLLFTLATTNNINNSYYLLSFYDVPGIYNANVTTISLKYILLSSLLGEKLMLVTCHEQILAVPRA